MSPPSPLAPGPLAEPGGRSTTPSRWRLLNAAIDPGVNFIDTADVYGDGHREQLIAQLKKDRPGDTIIVATKAGRRLPVQAPEATLART